MAGCSNCEVEEKCDSCFGGYKKVEGKCEGEGPKKWYKRFILWIIIILPVLLFVLVWVASALKMFCFKAEEGEDVEIGYMQGCDTEEIDL